MVPYLQHLFADVGLWTAVGVTLVAGPLPDEDTAAGRCTAFASLGKPLAPITQDACAFFEDHVVIGEEAGQVAAQKALEKLNVG